MQSAKVAQIFDTPKLLRHKTLTTASLHIPKNKKSSETCIFFHNLCILSFFVIPL